MSYTVKRISELVQGDTLRAWDEGDPWTGTVASVTPRPVLSVSTGPLQWVYDVAYESGHIAYSQDGESVRKVVTA